MNAAFTSDPVMAPRRAVFLDKDGTLIVDVPYNADPAKLEFQPGAREALAAFAAAGFALVIVSNQSGLALGRFTHDAFAALRRVLAERLWREAGVALLDFVFCPHARDTCACRKPSPLMLHVAAREFGLDLSRSWMVGDTLDDVEAGRRAGCRCRARAPGDRAADCALAERSTTRVCVVVMVGPELRGGPPIAP